MITVGADQAEVERSLAGGELECPLCGGVLARWGHARPRVLRGGQGPVRLRRARCPGCGSTHVLLPAFALLRRADLAEVIGAALAARAVGKGARPIAAASGRALATVRGWLRRSGRGRRRCGSSSPGCWWRPGWIRSRRRRGRRRSPTRSRRLPGPRRWFPRAGRASAGCRRGGRRARPAAGGCFRRAGPGSRPTRVPPDAGCRWPGNLRGLSVLASRERGFP